MMTSSATFLLIILAIQSCYSLPLDIAQDLSEDEYTTEGCPPGIWVCKRKRQIPQDLAQERDPAAVSLPAAAVDSAEECPPGVWTCKKNQQAALRQAPKFANDADECPPGIWVCRRKRMMKARAQREAAMRQKALLEKKQISAAGCPPGIWVCWNITQEYVRIPSNEANKE